MNSVAFTKEQKVKMYARVNEASIPIVFTFVNEDGSAHDITAYDFKLAAKKRPNSDDNEFLLEVGDGLSVIGADTNKLQVLLSAAVATVRPSTYFYRIYSETEDNTWFADDFIFHEGKFDHASNTSETITINNGTVEVLVTISAGGGGLSTVTVDGVTIQGDGSVGNPLAVIAGVFDTAGSAAAVQTNLNTHTSNTSNPHSVTKTQVGLGNADNTSDAGKPVSTAQQTALDLKQNLIITETVLVDAATIDIAQQNNTLATSRTTITFTISNTATFIYLTITLTGTSLVITFPANSLCVSNGTASGDNTCALAGVSGDVYEIAIKKRGATYSPVAFNFGQ